MKRGIFKIELFLTILCLVMIYSLGTRPAAPVTYNVVVAPMPVKKHSDGTREKLKNLDSYAVASHTADQALLSELAEREAQRMLETGDTKRFQEELQKNKLLLNIVGY